MFISTGYQKATGKKVYRNNVHQQTWTVSKADWNMHFICNQGHKALLSLVYQEQFCLNCHLVSRINLAQFSLQ